MYFRYYRLLKTWLDKRLKSLFLEDRLTRNTVKWRKYRYNLNDITVPIFSDHFEGK